MTGEHWVGDVGQNSWEEIDIVEAGSNYGWNAMEGKHCYPPSVNRCDTTGLSLPVWEYSHDYGCSIIGGYVYRGGRLPSLYGMYLYADYCSGRIWALQYDGEKVVKDLELMQSNLDITSFAEDRDGEVYILTSQGGIYTLQMD